VWKLGTACTVCVNIQLIDIIKLFVIIALWMFALIVLSASSSSLRVFLFFLKNLKLLTRL